MVVDPTEINDLRVRVCRHVARVAPAGRFGALGGHDDVPLGATGLGLDSVRLVELLLLCEDELGVALPADALPAMPSLTVGHFVTWVGERVAASRASS